MRIGWVGRLVMAGLLLGALAGMAHAGEGTSNMAAGRMRKLGRGLSNIVTAPAELLRTPELRGRRDGYLSALTIGVVEGTWRTLVRGVTGVYEVVTFYSEVPKGFEPIIRPEYVWEHGDWAE